MRQVLRWLCVPRRALWLAVFGVLLPWLAVSRRRARSRTRPGGHHDPGRPRLAAPGGHGGGASRLRLARLSTNGAAGSHGEPERPGGGEPGTG
jgi:hypothetical protein